MYNMKTLLIFIPFLITGCVINPPLYLHVASPVEGKVSLNNLPVEDAIITRKCISGWYGEFPAEITKSNKDGLYEFPSIKKFSPIILIHMPTIWQEFTIEYGGKVYLAHKNYRNNYSKYGELESKHNFDENPNIGGVGTNIYVYPVDNTRYQTEISKNGKFIELNFDLNNLNEYTSEPEPIPASSFADAEKKLEQLKIKMDTEPVN